MKLTEKQKRFADEYIKSGNATQAAIKAGYSKRTANRIGPENLSKLVIKDYIDERMKVIEDNRIMTAKEAVEFLTSVVRGQVKEMVVIGTPMGAEEVEKEPDVKTRISAAKEILKRYPDNDKVMEQQLRKLTAEADIAEAKAKEYIEDSSAYDEIHLVFAERQKEGHDNED
ncbi:terminase small subunit [Weissella paramesenteroides]|uniref:terminase small subunit n=1 Tax=Weissella paramesenteroides TaxID=1249 RepID=UPI002072D7FF|nr:terminase small subunit [Weissella paramesenteroides]MCM6765890.1 terminase small subunit [Weissella paramesenteroides]MCM6767259.1 terminase small subunit [Weissella paramesenteroides]MCM6769553.1 terminase small subunit [Weissella paramesenteroides]MCM6770005.1 terminase small subunit [Weissella paramesenteroides]MCM6779927.1 terminase small subunit [Weissella paramesenteroides]